MSWSATYNQNSIDVYEDRRFFASYELLTEPYCPRCAAPIANCRRCRDLYGLNRIYAMGIYHRGPPYPQLTRHILDLKEDVGIAESLTTALKSCIENRYPELIDSEIIIPVPIHDRKLSERGFNQANLLSARLGSKMNFVSGDILIQTRYYSQRNASRAERFANVKGAIKLDKRYLGHIKNRKIIIIDDVTTSGATLSECSKVLMNNNANGTCLARFKKI